MGCEFSSHHLNTSLGASRPRTPQRKVSSTNSNASSTRGVGSASSVASHGSFERRGSLLLSSRRSLTRQRTIEQVEHAAVVKRQPLNEYFTEFEKDVLISTWEALLLYTNEHGAFIFRLAAEMCPELKNAYNFEFNRDDEFVFSSCALQHSQGYIALIDEAIRSLEDPQEGFYDSVLIAGASHAAIPHMKPDYFQVRSSIPVEILRVKAHVTQHYQRFLKRATLTIWEGLLGEEFTGDVKQAWQTLLDYVVAVMVEGSRVFEEEERRCTLMAATENDSSLDEQSRLDRRTDVKLNE